MTTIQPAPAYVASHRTRNKTADGVTCADTLANRGSGDGDRNYIQEPDTMSRVPGEAGRTQHARPAHDCNPGKPGESGRLVPFANGGVLVGTDHKVQRGAGVPLAQQLERADRVGRPGTAILNCAGHGRVDL